MSDISKKVLIVDDENAIIDIIESILEEHFYSVDLRKASNGLDAFIACQQNKYDLIITDHQMPFMTGAALVVGIKTRENQNKNTNIVMLSGFIDQELKDKLNPQKVDFLGKPFDETDLVNLVTPYLI